MFQLAILMTGSGLIYTAQVSDVGNYCIIAYQLYDMNQI